MVKTIQSINKKIQNLNLSVFTVAVGVFLISYFLLFVYPVFHLTGKMEYFQYLKNLPASGEDLRWTIQSINFKGEYIELMYSPLSNMFFHLFDKVSFKIIYVLFSAFSVITLTFNILVLPQKLGQQKSNLLVAMIFVLALFSYPFQFEIERGQWDVIIIFFVFFAIYCYHNNKLALAFAFFSFAIQLKLYPVIFIFAFVKDFRNLKKIFYDWSILFLINFVLLFIKGYQTFISYVLGTVDYVDKPFLWFGNISVSSFVHGLNLPSYFIPLFFAVYLSCLGYVVFKSRKNNISGNNPTLILILTIGAIILTNTSHDYRISILFPAIVYLLLYETKINSLNDIVFFIILFGAFFYLCFSYSAFSYLSLFKDIKFILMNKFSAIFILLIFITLRFRKQVGYTLP